MTAAAAPVGYAVMCEALAPRRAVDLARAAEEAGFVGTAVSDRFQPWLPAQGQAGYVWDVLATIAEHTHGPIGPMATCPSYRTHPAVVAQAAATLAALHPGRVWLGLGAGEAINEHVTGDYWPEAPGRIQRMFEAAEIVRKLFTGREVRHEGRFHTLEKTRLWTLPDETPPIYVATSGPVTARRAGATYDGIITDGDRPERTALLFERFLAGARTAGRDTTHLARIVRLHVSWAPTTAEAEAAAVAWWPNEAIRYPAAEVRDPRDFEALARNLTAADFEGRMTISADPDVHRARIQRYLDMGATHVYVHNAHPDQERFIEVFGREVLPALHP